MANLLHLKASRTQVLNTFPKREFGKDGDIIISRIAGRGVYLCTKAGNTWYVANKLEELRNIGKTSLKGLKVDNLEIKDIPNAESNTDKFIVSDKGRVKYRSSKEVVDDLPIPIDDITYKQAYCSLEQYSTKGDCEVNGGTWYYSDNDSHDSISSTAENQLLTVGQSIGTMDAEPTLLYDGSTLEIKRNAYFDENWQTSTQNDLLKLSYDSDKVGTIGIGITGAMTFIVEEGNTFNFYERQASGALGIRATINADTGVFKLSNPANALDYFSIDVDDNAVTEIKTYDSGSTVGHLTLVPDGDLVLDPVTDETKVSGVIKIAEQADASADTAGYGQLWVDTATPNILMFTDDAGQDIHLTKNTAVWGGGLARTTGANGKWLGIPTGHQGGYISFGTTDTAPDVIYNPTTTADDLGGVIWQSIHSIRVTACRIWYGEGGSSNTRHILCLMRYDIDSSGTLSNGVEVAGVDSDSGSDDYTTLAFTDLTMTSDAMIYNSDLANAAMSAKCILEYQDLP